MNAPTPEELERAREDGRRDAAKGLTRFDYPWDYADGPLRDAWADGWERFHREGGSNAKA